MSTGHFFEGELMAPVPMRTPAGGLPALPTERVKVMLKTALADEARGNLLAAENNLRLAMAFGPDDGAVKEALARVSLQREAERRKTARP